LQVDEHGFKLTPSLQDKGLDLEMRTGATIYYWGFNMLDPVVGGDSIAAKKLRQAISLALNVEEHIGIFLSGLGVVGSGPLPPDLFGYSEQYALAQPLFAMPWEQRLAKARQLLVEAGYPNGRHQDTGEALVLGYDVNLTGSPDDKARFAWFSKQLARLGIEVEVRATQLSRFQQKIRSGDFQIFYWNWVGDYPDPENFLFLLYGKEGTVRYGGNNKANYENPEYDRLFKQMKNMENTPERARVIKQMLEILNEDVPWVWGYYPEVFTISQSWVGPTKPSDMVRNALKYQSIDPVLRAKLREEWNKPITWPLIVLGIGFILILLPVVFGYYRKQYKK
jgi:oligopeptide transport system substrate-binding protein